MWVPEPIWTTWRKENSRPYRDSNTELSAVQPVASRYTGCATAALLLAIIRFNLIQF
jgi:hypothetical protein